MSLGDSIYVVERDNDWFIVHKLQSGHDPVIYEIDDSGRCSCIAARYNNECKHVLMAFNELEGDEVMHGVARRSLDTFFDTLRAQRPDVICENLVDYNRRETQTVATGICRNFPPMDDLPERFTLWAEGENGVMLRIHVIEDMGTYNKVISKARKRHRRVRG